MVQPRRHFSGSGHPTPGIYSLRQQTAYRTSRGSGQQVAEPGQGESGIRKPELGQELWEELRVTGWECFGSDEEIDMCVMDKDDE